MKKIIIILLLISYLFSCKSTIFAQNKYHNYSIDTSLIDFAINLINDPNKIMNIQVYFPMFFDSNIISIDYQDSNIISKWYNLLKAYPKLNYSNINYRTRGFSDDFLENSIKKMKFKDLKPDNFVNVVIMRTCSQGIVFYFVLKNDKYFYFSMNEFLIYSGTEIMDCDKLKK